MEDQRKTTAEAGKKSKPIKSSFKFKLGGISILTIVVEGLFPKSGKIALKCHFRLPTKTN